MARIRTIKPDFWTSEKIVACSPISRLLFVGLWNFSDDAGRQPARVRQIKMQIFPGDNFTTSDITEMLVELVDNRLIHCYQVDKSWYLQIIGWSKHQRIDRPTVRYPAPNEEKSLANNNNKSASDRGPLSTNSPNNRRSIDDLTPSPHPRKGREGKGMESLSDYLSSPPKTDLSRQIPQTTASGSASTNLESGERRNDTTRGGAISPDVIHRAWRAVQSLRPVDGNSRQLIARAAILSASDGLSESWLRECLESVETNHPKNLVGYFRTCLIHLAHDRHGVDLVPLLDQTPVPRDFYAQLEDHVERSVRRRGVTRIGEAI